MPAPNSYTLFPIMIHEPIETSTGMPEAPSFVQGVNPSPPLREIPMRAALNSEDRRSSLGLRLRADTEDYSKMQMVHYAASQVPAGAIMLDAGAGQCPHRKLFKHARYESSDFIQNTDNSIDYVCDIQKMTCPTERYDAALCIQVIDDLPEPQRAIDELYRVLKPGGSLFLTAPLSGRVHNEPYHFFHFSRNGLEAMFRKAGFDIVAITPRGGIFWYYAYLLKRTPKYVVRQLEMACDAASGGGRLLRGAALTAARAICWLSKPIMEYALPILCFHLDALDRERAFTLGYACHCRKPDHSMD